MELCPGLLPAEKIVPATTENELFEAGIRKFVFQKKPDKEKFTFRYRIADEVDRHPALSEKMLRLQFHLPQSNQDAVVWLDNLEYSLE